MVINRIKQMFCSHWLEYVVKFENNEFKITDTNNVALQRVR